MNQIRFRVFALVLLFLACGCREHIIHDLDEREINKVLTRLDEIGIFAQRIQQPDGLWSVSVESSETFRALQHLEETRAFRANNRDTSDSKSMLPSREEQRFQFERDLSIEIESTLLAIDGVLEARVHLNLPQTDPLFGQPLAKSPSSASVLIVAKKGARIPKDQISTLVGGASGVDPKWVSVLLTETTISANKKLLIETTESETLIGYISKKIGEQDFIIELAVSFLVLGLGLLWMGRKRVFKGGHHVTARI